MKTLDYATIARTLVNATDLIAGTAPPPGREAPDAAATITALSELLNAAWASHLRAA